MPRPALKVLAVLVLGIVVAAVFAPPLWHRYLEALARRSAPLYQPRERVRGGDEPPAPRVAADTELLDARALEQAARYAGEHGSRALIVVRHDHIVFERYWQGTNFDTLSDAQSFTPLLAALATGVAVAHRRIGWPDEPLGLLLAEWSADARGAISVRNLMQMSSGLAPQASLDGPDLTAAILSRPLIGTPGVTRVEQPSDPQLLALALERATRERYADYLSTVLWRRLGAADAWLWLDHPGGMAHADCCMFAHQGDWIRVGQMLLRDGNYRGAEIIRGGWVSLMRTPAKSDSDFGSFLRLGLTPPRGQEGFAARDVYMVGSRGGNRLWIIPALQIAVLCTGDAGGRDAAWDEARIPNLIMRGARDYRPPAPPPGTALSSVVPGH
jgi:CubicO group peptidase (beta-lactamase class C family)